MPIASDRKSNSERELGGAARSSNEIPVSSAKNPNPKGTGVGNTEATRPHPDGARLTPEEIARSGWRPEDEPYEDDPDEYDPEEA